MAVLLYDYHYVYILFNLRSTQGAKSISYNILLSIQQQIAGI